MSYRVHRFDLKMTRDEQKLERFLNGLKGDVVSIVPNVSMGIAGRYRVDFVLVVEKVD